MSAQKNAFYVVRIPTHYEILDLYLGTGFRMPDFERLPTHACSQLGKVRFEQRLLLSHPLGAGNSRTNVTDLHQIRKRSLRIE